MRAVRVVADKIGLLQALERSPSRKALWVRSLFGIYDSQDLIHLDLPWWTFPAIDEVESRLKRIKGGARVFEYGAGASTMWLAKRCLSVASVEHDIVFARMMQPVFATSGRIRLEMIPPGPATGSAGEARSKRKGHEYLSFDAYVNAIDQYEGSFDLIVIDGRARTACLARALPRLAPAGMILFDNSDREEYRHAIDKCGLTETVYNGLAPALPMRSRTSILARENH